ncbi:MAG: serine protease [Bacteroidota bacterium]
MKEEKTFQKLNKEQRFNFYGASHFLNNQNEKDSGLQIPFEVYLQDPMVASEDIGFGFDEKFYVRWEPGLSDGPTSARFAIVDYNSDTGQLMAPAHWNAKEFEFTKDGQPLNANNSDSFQFHQLNVWALLQNALNFFEHGNGLGRPIPWGFEGNRLIVVPHAGYGKNAFYDRESKSLQFYYFGPSSNRVYTCLSADIIHHEFGHAVLDGIRPYFIESSSLETAAFHEFVADFTAILIILRNNTFRKRLVELTKGDWSKAKQLSFIAEEFGRRVKDRPYLRSADNKLRMRNVRGKIISPHNYSQVMTGAMYSILRKISEAYMGENSKLSASQSYYLAVDRMQRTAIQPLDLLPPVDVTFRDYALAVLRAEELSHPKDPNNYFGLMLDVFVQRGILSRRDKREQLESRYLYYPVRMQVFHDIDRLSSSRAAAYRFLDDNREVLFIPRNRDIVVADLYRAKKYARQRRRLPDQIILEYIWREDLQLDDPKYGQLNGTTVSMLCGGTLVFDQNGNVLSWFRKPGTESIGTRKAQKAEQRAGKARQKSFLKEIYGLVRNGQLGLADEQRAASIARRLPTITAREVDGRMQFHLSPHINLSDTDHDKGERQWEISS